MNRRRIAAAAMVLVMVLSAGACAQEKKATFTGDTTVEPEDQANLNAISPSAYGDVRGLALEPGTYISIIGKMEGTSYWKAVRDGVMQAAEDLNAQLGYSGNDKIKVTYNGPAKAEDIDEQVNILDEELSRYPDVIGIASIDEAACTVQFDLAAENGIPIIALDSGNQYQGIQCTVKTDNREAARTGAYKLADEIDKKGDVIVLAHDSKSETARERVQSFQEEMEQNHPDIHVVEVIYCDMLDDIKKEMAAKQNEKLKEGERPIEKESFSDMDAVQYMMEKYPNLRGIFGTNSSATLLALESIRRAGQVRTEEDEMPEKNSGRSDASGDGKNESGNASGTSEEEKNGEAASDTSEEEKSGEAASDTSEEEKSGEAASAASGEEKSEDVSAVPENGKDGSAPASEDQNEESGNQDGSSRDTAQIMLVGFDTGKEQLLALESGEIAGLIVQNPFGMGYASVVAAARTVLEAGNEAEVSTSYLWLTKDNMNEESIQKMLYE